MDSLVEWLNSREGDRWSRSVFRQVTYHAMIEFLGDGGGCWVSDGRTLRAHRDQPVWRDLEWTPDVPPEGGVPVRVRKLSWPRVTFRSVTSRGRVR